MIKFSVQNGVDSHRTVSGVEGLLQRIYIRLRTHRGEWVLDENAGLPWIEWLDQKPFPAQEVADTIFLELTEVEGITAISSINVTKNLSAVRITAVIHHEYGDDPLTSQFQVDNTGIVRVVLGNLSIRGIVT